MRRCSYTPPFLEAPFRCSQKRKRMSDSLVARRYRRICRWRHRQSDWHSEFSDVVSQKRVARSHKTACQSHTTTQAKSKRTSACQTRYWHSCIKRKFRLRHPQRSWHSEFSDVILHKYVAGAHKTACHSHTTAQAKSQNNRACQSPYRRV